MTHTLHSGWYQSTNWKLTALWTEKVLQAENIIACDQQCESLLIPATHSHSHCDCDCVKSHYSL